MVLEILPRRQCFIETVKKLVFKFSFGFQGFKKITNKTINVLDECDYVKKCLEILNH